MKTTKRNAKGSLGIVALLLFLGTLAYLDVSGQTDSWPKASYQIVENRAVPLIAYGRPEVVLWKGEDLLQYEVNGQQHSIWADAVNWNEDRRFVEYSLSNGRERSYTVRFNPANPSEAVAKINSN
jgi:hypothetical protein